MYFIHPVDSDISLALPQPSMAPELFEIIDKNREYLATFLPWAKTTLEIKDTANFIHKSLKDYSEQKSIQLIIIYRGKIAGAIGFNHLNMDHKNAEIGYWLAEEYTSKGIMTKVVKSLFDYGFSVLGLHRIEICCDTKNIPSQKVTKRLGMKQDGILRGNAFENGKFCDTIVYSVLKTEWDIQ
jgi:ribosomal-protein-serine acetyltransferase